MTKKELLEKVIEDLKEELDAVSDVVLNDDDTFENTEEGYLDRFRFVVESMEERFGKMERFLYKNLWKCEDE